MRKLILFMHTSVDGFTAGPNGEMDWITVDDEIFDDVLELQHGADTALFGGVLYQEMAAYWPTVPANPSSTRSKIEHATWLNHSRKIVFSRTLQKAEWNNSRIIRENIPAEIQELKEQSGKNLLLFGGAGIARNLGRLGLIDEYRLNLNPVALGAGKALFQDVGDKRDLELVDARTFKAGVVALRYEPRREA